MNILIVDDEIVIINILKETIDWKSIGIDQVFSAYNAFEARKVLEEHSIDIIICDIEMPQENGLQLLKWVNKYYPNILNIILTGFPDFNYAQSAISIGVYKFLVKPLVFADLIIIIQEAVDKIEKEMIKEKLIKYGEYLIDRIDSKKPVEVQINTVVNKLIEPATDNIKEQSVVNVVKNYLELHYNENISRKDVEALVHLNEDYLNRIYKQSTGYSLMEYIQFYRIMVAKRMLLNSYTSISEIAVQIGYDSPAYFSKIFKKFTGVTPAEYRNNKNIS